MVPRHHLSEIPVQLLLIYTTHLAYILLLIVLVYDCIIISITDIVFNVLFQHEL